MRTSSSESRHHRQRHRRSGCDRESQLVRHHLPRRTPPLLRVPPSRPPHRTLSRAITTRSSNACTRRRNSCAIPSRRWLKSSPGRSALWPSRWRKTHSTRRMRLWRSSRPRCAQIRPRQRKAAQVLQVRSALSRIIRSPWRLCRRRPSSCGSPSKRWPMSRLASGATRLVRKHTRRSTTRTRPCFSFRCQRRFKTDPLKADSVGVNLTHPGTFHCSAFGCVSAGVFLITPALRLSFRR